MVCEQELFARGKPTRRREAVPTLRAFRARYFDEHCKAERHKPSMLAFKENVFDAYLVPILGEKPLDEIDNADVQKLKAALADKAPKTVNNVLTTLSTVLKKAVEWGVTTTMPTIKLLKVHYSERSFHDFDELERLIAAAAKIDARSELVVLLGAHAGLRIGEILGLRWCDVVFERRLRVVQAEWKGHVTLPKGGRSREVPLTSRLTNALKGYRHLIGLRVLDDDDGEAPSAKVARSWMRAAEKRAGLEVTGRIHILRHTFCSHLAIRGAPAKAIQELAGHADLTTTMRYMHLSPSARSSAIALLEEGGNGARAGEMLEKNAG